MIDRSEVNRSLAKAIAFKAVGNDRAANAWAARLVRQLECSDILVDYGEAYDDEEALRRTETFKNTKGCPDHLAGIGVIGCTGCSRRNT